MYLQQTTHTPRDDWVVDKGLLNKCEQPSAGPYTVRRRREIPATYPTALRQSPQQPDPITAPRTAQRNGRRKTPVTRGTSQGRRPPTQLVELDEVGTSFDPSTKARRKYRSGHLRIGISAGGQISARVPRSCRMDQARRALPIVWAREQQRIKHMAALQR